MDKFDTQTRVKHSSGKHGVVVETSDILTGYYKVVFDGDNFGFDIPGYELQISYRGAAKELYGALEGLHTSLFSSIKDKELCQYLAKKHATAILKRYEAIDE